ncbi:hypothetical protein ES707_00199 [subsurface metagenome]
MEKDLQVGQQALVMVVGAVTQGDLDRVLEVKAVDRKAPVSRGELMAYTDIAITAPNSAEEGEPVSVSAQVTNITASDLLFGVKIYAVEDIYAVPEPHEIIGTFEEVIENGITKTYSASFTMPAWNTTVLVMVHRFVVHWDYDNRASKVVSLKTKALPAVLGIGALAALGFGALAILGIALVAQRK